MNDTRIRKIARVGKARDFKSQIPYFKKVKPDLGHVGFKPKQGKTRQIKVKQSKTR